MNPNSDFRACLVVSARFLPSVPQSCTSMDFGTYTSLQNPGSMHQLAEKGSLWLPPFLRVGGVQARQIGDHLGRSWGSPSKDFYQNLKCASYFLWLDNSCALGPSLVPTYLQTGTTYDFTELKEDEEKEPNHHWLSPQVGFESECFTSMKTAKPALSGQAWFWFSFWTFNWWCYFLTAVRKPHAVSGRVWQVGSNRSP